jgi:hypothetical protein
VLLNWVGEIDTSLLDESYIEFGVEKIWTGVRNIMRV